MSFSTDHINNKLDNLSLVDQSSNSTSNNQSTTSSSNRSNYNDDEDEDDDDEDVDIDSSGLMLNASNNSNATFIPLLQSNNNNNTSNQIKQIPKKSLLSSSLAGEKRNIINSTTSINYNTINDQPHYTSSSHTNFTQSQSINIDIPTSKSSSNYTDEHPEPELLATSVGKEIDGTLLPSSSTISLLSLNYNHDQSQQAPIHHHQPQPQQQQQYLYNQKSPKVLQQSTFQQQPPLQQPTSIDRKNSFSNIISRGSLTHLNQQRLQPYQRLTSPPPPPPPASSASSNPTTSNVTHYYPEYILSHSTTTAQTIPTKNNLPSNPNDMVMEVPESPYLDATSVGGSPSRFWLSSQTPPNGQRTLNRNHMYQPQHPTYIPLTNVNNTTQVSSSIPINSTTNGGDSPTLDPVQTPLEDPPMTPLYLNKNISPSVAQDSYFGNYRIDEQTVQNSINNNDDDLDDEIDEVIGNSTKVNDYEMK
ncbi:hypothetical protein DFJ63DRAFT_337828 [Scheffersomyces coipomensis]|uniref:uncharacterized protein n=1 Tax=Scheffersomyces coipomensis TaxID=1788519 RepID=UPI00315C9725